MKIAVIGAGNMGGALIKGWAKAASKKAEGSVIENLSCINIADRAWRSYATARFALRMSKNEALQLWSGMTLGMSVGDMPYSEETLDRMWHIVQMPQGKLMQDSNLQPEVERARRIRAVFSGGE